MRFSALRRGQQIKLVYVCHAHCLLNETVSLVKLFHSRFIAHVALTSKVFGSAITEWQKDMNSGSRFWSRKRQHHLAYPHSRTHWGQTYSGSAKAVLLLARNDKSNVRRALKKCEACQAAQHRGTCQRLHAGRPWHTVAIESVDTLS